MTPNSPKKNILQPAPGLGINAMMFFIIALGVLTGIYTVIGGLLAVVWTESIQTVLLLLGAVCITVVGYHAVGGWEVMSNLLLGLRLGSKPWLMLKP